MPGPVLPDDARTALGRLRARAVRAALFPPTGLAAAMERMGFVQADPIQAPARAQDLILRHRVRGYRAGDLHRAYPRLGLEEDFLHAYGFMTPATRALLHPRPDVDGGAHLPTGLAADVLAFVQSRRATHPADLEARFGRERAVNDWGGFSKATTRALEQLRHFGLLRVVRRRDGVRVYGATPATPPAEDDPTDRARRLVLLLAGLLAPVSLPSLRGALALAARRNPGLGPLAPAVAAAIRSGALERDTVDGETYVWPTPDGTPDDNVRPGAVRLLAPFDPLVWDRRRFAHLWGWEYRFEAYTPPAQRRMGYYAMPVLWGDAVTGWANVSAGPGGVEAALGHAGTEPRSLAFARGLESELARMGRFMTPRGAGGG